MIDFFKNSIYWLPYVMAIVAATCSYSMTSKESNFLGYSDITQIHEARVRLQKEGLDALSIWSKWLVGLQSAFIVTITLKPNPKGGGLENISWTSFGAIVSFAISLVAATILLGVIREALQKRPIKNRNGDYDVYSYKCFLMLPLRSFAGVEHVMFILGIIYVLCGLFQSKYSYIAHRLCA